MLEKGDDLEEEKRELTEKEEDVVENEPPLLVVDADLVKLPQPSRSFSIPEGPKLCDPRL